MAVMSEPDDSQISWPVRISAATQTKGFGRSSKVVLGAESGTGPGQCRGPGPAVRHSLIVAAPGACMARCRLHGVRRGGKAPPSGGLTAP